MTLESALAQGRLAAEARMSSRCTIRRKTGASVQVDGFSVPAWQVVAANLPIRLGTARAVTSRAVDVGGSQVAVGTPAAHLPIGSDVRDGDFIEVTAGEHAGRVYRVVEADGTDQATALRLPVVATERPKEWP